MHGANKEELLVRLDAEIPKGWHVYGITQLQGGTLPLVIRIEPGASYELTDKPRGTAPQRRHDASFDLDTELYTDSLKYSSHGSLSDVWRYDVSATEDSSSAG